MTPRNVVALLLAGGSGTRFGGGKLLHPLDDGVAIGAHAARNLLAAGLRVAAVVPLGDFPLAEMLEQEGCEVTMCSRCSRGMGASLAHGIEYARNADSWLVALGDMPRVTPATIEALAEAMTNGALIAAPVYRGSRGHPVAFAAKLRDELLQLDGDAGARAVVERHRDEVMLLDVADAGILQDVDTRAQLDELRGNAGR